MAGNTLIEAKGIYKSFSGVPVLQDVFFRMSILKLKPVKYML